MRALASLTPQHSWPDERPRADGDLFQAYATADAHGCHIVPPRFGNDLEFALAPRIESLYYEPKLAGRPAPLDAAHLHQGFPACLPSLLAGRGGGREKRAGGDEGLQFLPIRIR